MGEHLSVKEKINLFLWCFLLLLVWFGFGFFFVGFFSCTCSKYEVGELYILSNAFNFSEGY